MAGPSTSGKVIFIGNISFDLTEQQIMDIFADVGPIVNFKLMFDRETGKPRGFAFCEYADAETAASAIRNLNGHEINGRVLKVNYADQDVSYSSSSFQHRDERDSRDYRDARDLPTASRDAAATTTTSDPLFLTNPATLFAKHPQQTSTEAINGLLSSLSNTQLHELLVQLKTLALNEPAQCRQLFLDNAQLGYAVIHALLLMNAVDPRTVREVLGTTAVRQRAAHLPDVPNVSVANPAPTKAEQAEASTTSSTSPTSTVMNEELIKQIMALTEEQIVALPADQQQTVRLVRAQLQSRP
jgi:cleavage stimulation factor subunit 2